MLCWSIVNLCLLICACCQCTIAGFSCDMYIQHTCSFLDYFAIEVIAEGWARCWASGLWGLSISHAIFSVYEEGRKEIILVDYILQIYVYWFVTISLFIPGTFFFFFNSLYLRVTFSVVNYFLYVFLSISPSRDITYYFLPLLLTSLSVFSSKVHLCWDHWHNFIISMVIFEVGVIAPWIYIQYFFQI